MKQLFLLVVFCTLAFSSLHSQSDQVSSIPAKPQGEIFKVVDEHALFPGCDGDMEFEHRKKCAEVKMLDFIAENLRYPEEALSSEIEGKVYVQFVVELDGAISNIRVIRDLGAGTREEAIRLVQSMPLWQPARNGGKIVRSQFNLPINFELSPKPKKKRKN